MSETFLLDLIPLFYTNHNPLAPFRTKELWCVSTSCRFNLFFKRSLWKAIPHRFFFPSDQFTSIKYWRGRKGLNEYIVCIYNTQVAMRVDSLVKVEYPFKGWVTDDRMYVAAKLYNHDMRACVQNTCSEGWTHSYIYFVIIDIVHINFYY